MGKVTRSVYLRDRVTPQTLLVSKTPNVRRPNDSSSNPSISADGRLVAFYSAGSNIVEDDTNGNIDIFVFDRQEDTTTRVNIASDGTQANGSAQRCSLSPDGWFVAFSSVATNLVPNDTNGVADIFVHDRLGAPSPGVTVAPSEGLVTTEGGGTDTFTVVLNTEPSAPVTIGLSSGDASEGTVSPASVTFDATNWDTPQTVTVTGVDDAEQDGDVAYTIVTAAAVSTDPDYAGRDPDDVSVTNRDDEAPPAGSVTVESVVARDIRVGRKYNITASIRNGTSEEVSVVVLCAVDSLDDPDPEAPAQTLDARLVTIAPGGTATVKFNDSSDSSLSKGNYVATVTVQDCPDAEDFDTFRIK